MPEAGKPRRIIDVSSPGESTPTASSRPIIVSDKPSVQDPMVSNPAPNKTQPPAPPQPPPKEPKTQPLPSQPGQTAAEPEPDLHPDAKQIVHDKTYFVPIAKPPKRHGFPWLFALLVVILGAGLYLFLTIM